MDRERLPGSPPRVRHVLGFYLVACLLSWSLAGLYALWGQPWAGLPAMAVGVVYMFMPLFAAILMARRTGEAPREALGLERRPFNRWLLLAWLGPLVLVLLTVGVSVLLPGLSLSTGVDALLERLAPLVPPEQAAELRAQLEALPFHPALLAVLQGLAAGPTINALAAFGEEAGWRGYLYRHTIHLGFWRSSALVGALWGFWHAPLILMGHNYAQHPVAGVFVMTLWCTLLAPLFTLVRGLGGSSIHAAVAHGSVNALAGLPLMLVAGGDDLTAGVTGLPGILALLALNLALFASGLPRRIAAAA